jgi:hypothetical protein
MSDTKFPDSIPEEFWQVIEEAHQDRTKFREILKTMNRGQIVRFYWTYEELATRIRLEPYLDYADPDISEDGMAELANWIVGQGKEYYKKIFNHPELIPPMKNDIGFLSDVIIEYEKRYKTDMALNTHLWDDNWKQNGKKSPWSYTEG